MGTSIGKKIKGTEAMGFVIGDRVSHSKLGTSIGRILYFAEFTDAASAMYAMVDYGDRKRLEPVVDLLPVREDIYICTEEIW